MRDRLFVRTTDCYIAAADRTVKVWDLQAVERPRAAEEAHCTRAP